MGQFAVMGVWSPPHEQHLPSSRVNSAVKTPWFRCLSELAVGATGRRGSPAIKESIRPSPGRWNLAPKLGRIRCYSASLYSCLKGSCPVGLGVALKRGLVHRNAWLSIRFPLLADVASDLLQFESNR